MSMVLMAAEPLPVPGFYMIHSPLPTMLIKGIEQEFKVKGIPTPPDGDNLQEYELILLGGEGPLLLFLTTL